MPKPLPIKLRKEPLVEAVCQLRIIGKVPLNTVFPGLLLAKYPADVSQLQQLPAAMLPEPVRAMQPDMAFVPLVQLRFKNVLVMIGERAITVSNPAPYLGWAGFKPLIVEVFTVLLESKLVSWVERYSLKYTNVFKADKASDSLGALAWSLSVGQLDLDKGATTVRTQTLTDELVTIVTLSGSVIVQAEGQVPVQGALIDIDTICQNKPQEANAFAVSMSGELDRVRRVNKDAFFECLTDEGIHALDPVYE
ncbi:MAG TPA: TIGR04255 family protein [Burkholderiales bacterium]|jgi:uncharacterized protein (TIGR04255 family)|nr:TIGR04255 family protein [Burkholderiales bacterium]